MSDASDPLQFNLADQAAQDTGRLAVMTFVEILTGSRNLHAPGRAGMDTRYF